MKMPLTLCKHFDFTDGPVATVSWYIEDAEENDLSLSGDAMREIVLTVNDHAAIANLHDELVAALDGVVGLHAMFGNEKEFVYARAVLAKAGGKT